MAYMSLYMFPVTETWTQMFSVIVPVPLSADLNTNLHIITKYHSSFNCQQDHCTWFPHIWPHDMLYMQLYCNYSQFNNGMNCTHRHHCCSCIFSINRSLFNQKSNAYGNLSVMRSQSVCVCLYTCTTFYSIQTFYLAVGAPTDLQRLVKIWLINLSLLLMLFGVLMG